MSEPTPPKPSATVLLLRDAAALEVLMVKRHHQIDFASGALVFPGGKLDPADRDAAWSEASFGWDEIAAEERPLRIAALRESFEEAGVLLARRRSGEAFIADSALLEARRSNAAGEISFRQVVDHLGLKLDLLALTRFARWITPVMMPKRFDTYFYAAIAPKDQLAVSDGSETVDAEWISPHHALALAEAGERTIIFPTRMNLKLLAEATHAADAVARAAERKDIVVTPWVERREHGQVLVIPPDAGYGAVEEDLAKVGG